MSVSDVQIAKLALSHVGDRYDITSLAEATPEAEQVNLVFEPARDALLREHPWRFATRYVSPAALSGTPPAGWAYMFTYPSDAVLVRKLVHPLDPTGRTLPPLRWAASVNSAGAKVILTNEAEPEITYTAKVTDAAQFDAAFVMALSWRIAQMIAQPITGEASIVQRVARDGEYWIGQAKMQDANEGSDMEHDQAPDWIRARS